jgi:hypothetical protein
MKTWPCLKGQRPSLPGSVLLVSRGHPKWSGQQLKPLCRAPEIEEIEETTVLLASLLLVPILSNIVHCGLNLDYEQRSYIAAWKLHLKGWTSTTSCVLRRESLQQKPMASQGSELCLRSLNPIQSPDQTLSEQPQAQKPRSNCNLTLLTFLQNLPLMHQSIRCFKTATRRHWSMLVACWKPLDAPTQFTFFFGVFFFKMQYFSKETLLNLGWLPQCA